MGVIEEVGEAADVGVCPVCQNLAPTKCGKCKQIYYCSRGCQRLHWKEHKTSCLSMPYRLERSAELGRHLVASTSLSKGQTLFSENALVIGPSMGSMPVCVACYNPVDNNNCSNSTWPVCNQGCLEKARHQAEVVVTKQTDARFEIDSFHTPCDLYDCVTPLRALMMQRSAPKKFARILTLQSIAPEEMSDEQKKRYERISLMLKRTLGLMVFEALYPDLDLSDSMIYRICSILDVNGLDIRKSQDVSLIALFPTVAMLEHSCLSNVKLSFDENNVVKVVSGVAMEEGEHLSLMYTHCLWSTRDRRAHLFAMKGFWCKCVRCCDNKELDSNLSTMRVKEKCLVAENPLDIHSDFVEVDKGDMTEMRARLSWSEVMSTLTTVYEEHLTLATSPETTIDDWEAFLANNSQSLHPSHAHLLEAKHNLCQMIGRVEGHLIQDASEAELERKKHLCNELLEIYQKLDPHNLRLQVYTAVALYELHLPILQTLKRQWEKGDLTTNDFKTKLIEPRSILMKARDVLQDETKDERLTEGQLKAQVEATLTQLEAFMRTLGCKNF